MWKQGIGLASISLLVVGCASMGHEALTEPGQHAQTMNRKFTKTVSVNYLLSLPSGYDKSDADWPLLLFLHGAGERGEDLSKVKKWGPPRLVEEGRELPFIIVSPQCPEDEWWSSGLEIEAIDLLLDDIVGRYRVDKDRIYVTGMSMGGFGTWKLAMTYPDRFAAIAPVCGSGDPGKANRICSLPIWVFHGAKDDVVKPEESEKMVKALKECGSDVRFTLYPDAGHDSWSETYANPELYDWFLSHRRSAD